MNSGRTRRQLPVPTVNFYATVYILENREAQRVKVGMTINNAAERLRAVNDMWLERKGTCQICGGRLVSIRGRIPRHVVSGIGCSGGHALPLENDAALAEAHLANLRLLVCTLSGDEKASATRRIKTLEKRIAWHLHRETAVGVWQLSAAYYTERAEQVERLSHEFLREQLDRLAPFGEVFRCSSPQAMEAVERALIQVGVFHSARRLVGSNAP